MLFSNFISGTKMDESLVGGPTNGVGGSLGGSLEYLDGATRGSISKLRGWIQGRVTPPSNTPPRRQKRGLRQRLLVSQTATSPRQSMTQVDQQQQQQVTPNAVSGEQQQVAKPTTDWQLECKYTLQEVQQHSSLDDCWMVIFDKVYNITEFVDEHPGGDFILLEYAGRDATHPFLSSRHGSSAYKMLDKYWIGILVDEELYYSNNSSYCSVYSNLSWRSTPPATPPESDTSSSGKLSTSSLSSGISSKASSLPSSKLIIEPITEVILSLPEDKDDPRTPVIDNMLQHKQSEEERENEQERQLDEHLADITTTIYELFNIKPWDSDQDSDNEDVETNSQFSEVDREREKAAKGSSLQQQISSGRSRVNVDQQRELDAVEADEDDDDRCSPGMA